MKAVIQRVKQASVKIEKDLAGSIKKGFLVLVGIGEDDTKEDAQALAEQIATLRIMDDGKGKMNLDLQQVDGEVLIVSQFTLYADCSKGNRPSFVHAAEPEKAEELYEYFVEAAAEYLPVQTGEFGAYMDVALVNDGPVTIIIES
jgi:D-tyrosyl-tRNA(Tyr) deacylase